MYEILVPEIVWGEEKRKGGGPFLYVSRARKRRQKYIDGWVAPRQQARDENTRGTTGRDSRSNDPPMKSAQKEMGGFFRDLGKVGEKKGGEEKIQLVA